MTDTRPPLAQDLSRLLLREIDTLAREVSYMPDDESLWTTTGGVTNSVGTLALHCAGNLQHYVGALLGKTGYVRDRPREFNTRSGTRDEVVAELGRASAAVRETMAKLPHEALDGKFPEAVGGRTLPTRLFLLHLAVHLGFHVGQAGYLRRAITGDSRSADTVSIKAL
jgi:uncharacterized damage-inducible protein DinB